MAKPNRQAKPDIEKSVQELHNKSFDREFDVLAVENLVYNPTTNSLDRMTQGSVVADFQFNDSDNTTTASTEYFGYTKPDGTWMVKRLTATTLRYATVTNNPAVTTYTSAWASVASLTYGRFEEAF